MSIIEAASVRVSTMADGTLRLVVDVEPRNARAAFELFCSPGTPMALAALKTAAQQAEPEQKPEAPKGGALARLAGQWCNDEAFRVWLSKSAALPWSAAWDDHQEATPAQIAALVVRQLCGVKSRAELDSNDAAAMRFQELIRLPYMQHCGVAA